MVQWRKKTLIANVLITIKHVFHRFLRLKNQNNSCNIYRIPKACIDHQMQQNTNLQKIIMPSHILLDDLEIKSCLMILARNIIARASLSNSTPVWRTR